MNRVVVESPYTGNVALNTRYARAAIADCLKRGEAPFASHLLYTQPGVLDDSKPDERAKGIDAGHVWMQDVEVIAVYTDLGISDGMKKGIEAASKVNNCFANRCVIEFRTLPEFMAKEDTRKRDLNSQFGKLGYFDYRDLQEHLFDATHIVFRPAKLYPDSEQGSKWGLPFNFPRLDEVLERKVPRYQDGMYLDAQTLQQPIPFVREQLEAEKHKLQCEVLTLKDQLKAAELRLGLANTSLAAKREKLAKFDEVCEENNKLHDQVAAQADQIQQLTDDLEVSELSRQELYKAIQPFARSGQQIIDYPPKGLVETNLYVAVKHETKGEGWWYQPAYHFPADLRAAAKYLKKA